MPMMCRLFKVRCLPAGLLLFMAAAGWAQPAPRADAARIEARVTALMARMTLAEKLGQLTQYSGEWDATVPRESVVVKNGQKVVEVTIPANQTRTFDWKVRSNDAE